MCGLNLDSEEVQLAEPFKVDKQELINAWGEQDDLKEGVSTVYSGCEEIEPKPKHVNYNCEAIQTMWRAIQFKIRDIRGLSYYFAAGPPKS